MDSNHWAQHNIKWQALCERGNKPSGGTKCENSQLAVNLFNFSKMTMLQIIRKKAYCY